MDIAKALLWLSRDQFPPQKAFQFFFLLWNPGVKYRTSFSETFFHNVKIFELLLNLTGAQNSLSWDFLKGVFLVMEDMMGCGKSLTSKTEVKSFSYRTDKQRTIQK